MTTIEIANRLVALCLEGKNEQAITELFSDNARSIEADESMGPKIVEGKEGILAKNQYFHSSLASFHGQEISSPVVGGNHFSISWSIDVTFKGRERTQMAEICVYTVENGKIVSEQFFY
jgi:hypothetical protein